MNPSLIENLQILYYLMGNKKRIVVVDYTI